MEVSSDNKSIKYESSFGDGELSYYYHDSLFESVYSNLNLAVLSSVQTIAAGGSESAKEFFSENGFYDIELVNYDTNSDSRGYTHKSNFAIAKKCIKNRYIISVAIRGTKGNEWYSNFDIYNENHEKSDVHYGFKKSSESIYDYIKNYAKEIKNAEYWITGHSRGAACANILCKMLEDDGEKAYAYTFASPNVGTKDYISESYHVYNYVAKNDLICHIPFNMKGWEYGRNGKTFVLGEDENGFRDMTGISFHAVLEKDLLDMINSLYSLAKNPYEYYNNKYDGMSVYNYFNDCIVPLLMGSDLKSEDLITDKYYGTATKFFMLNSGGDLVYKYKNILDIDGRDNFYGMLFEHSKEAYYTRIKKFREGM